MDSSFDEVEKKAKFVISDFKKFVAKGNVFDLAVAVVVGTAFNKIVTALVENIITPLTSIILPGGDISSLKAVISPATEENPDLGIEATEEIAITYGVFLEAILDFLVIAICMYFAMKIVMAVRKALTKKERELALEKAKEKAEKEKVEAESLRKEKEQFVQDVAAQATLLSEIKDVLLRIEGKTNK